MLGHYVGRKWPLTFFSNMASVVQTETSRPTEPNGNFMTLSLGQLAARVVLYDGPRLADPKVRPHQSEFLSERAHPVNSS